MDEVSPDNAVTRERKYEASSLFTVKPVRKQNLQANACRFFYMHRYQNINK